MSTRPYSIRRARLVPDLNDPNLYGAWGMVPQGGLLVDHTAQGNDGTPGAASGVEQTILGPMRRYLPNSGVRASRVGAANAFALTDLTLDFWVRVDIGAASNVWLCNYFLGSGVDGWGFYWSAGNQLAIYDDIDNADQARYLTAMPNGKLIHVVGAMDSLENLLYADGVLLGSGQASSDTWSSFAGTFDHGARLTNNNVAIGIIGPLRIFNAAKDQTWVTKEYEKGARACQWKSDFGIRQSVGNENAVGAYIGVNSSPARIVSGTWQASMDAIRSNDVKVIENVAAGINVISMTLAEATPTECAFGTYEFWAKKTDAGVITIGFISTDETVAANGYNLVWAADESVVIAEAGVGNVVTGGTATANVWHKFKITRRYDGLFTLYIDDTLVGTGTDLTVTSSNYIVMDMDAGDKVSWSSRGGDYAICKYLGVI